MKPELMDESWYIHLKYLFEDGTMEKIRSALTSQTCPKNFKHIFRAFLMPLNEVKICLLGLSPYPNVNDATGLAFGVNGDRPYAHWPFSLKVINDAISYDYSDITYALDPSLVSWEKQGIFLTNVALTCEAGQALSHIELWRPFTEKVIKLLDENRIIFYLLGNEAKSYKQHIKYSAIFESVHPAALAYNADLKFDSKFKEVDYAHYLINKSNINW